MSTPRILLSTVGACAAFLLAAWSAGARASTSVSAQAAKATKVANPITGEGLPNPAPKVTRNWGQLPAGRKWGTSAGIDIDPKDGQIWAYERCGAGTAGGGPVDCDNTPVDPGLQVRSQHRGGARQLWQGRHGDPPRHSR